MCSADDSPVEDGVSPDVSQAAHEVAVLVHAGGGAQHLLDPELRRREREAVRVWVCTSGLFVCLQHSSIARCDTVGETRDGHGVGRRQYRPNGIMAVCMTPCAEAWKSLHFSGQSLPCGPEVIVQQCGSNFQSHQSSHYRN